MRTVLAVLLAVVFAVHPSAQMEGMFFALDAASGKPLWQFQTGGAIWSNPISYQTGGHQFVAIAAGSAIVVFGLAGP